VRCAPCPSKLSLFSGGSHFLKCIAGSERYGGVCSGWHTQYKASSWCRCGPHCRFAGYVEMDALAWQGRSLILFPAQFFLACCSFFKNSWQFSSLMHTSYGATRCLMQLVYLATGGSDISLLPEACLERVKLAEVETHSSPSVPTRIDSSFNR
jgi:hypothetical protein